MDQIVARKLKSLPDTQGLPSGSAWANATPVTFCSDWRAENPTPGRQTEVRMLWSNDFVFFRFHCRYQGIFTYEGGNTRRDRLWTRDVAEVFIRPPAWKAKHYLEFEISPNGDWLDLDISPGKKSILYCDLKSRVVLERDKNTWTADMAIPVGCFGKSLDPGDEWRLNFFRIEGQEDDRFYSAWIPTYTPRPNFHIPDVFGLLYFQN